MSAYSTFAQRYNNPSQTNRDPDRTDQIMNNAGGYSFQITPLQQFRRFLILGTNSGTYYVHRDTLTKENVDNIKAIFNGEEAKIALDILLEISEKGLAPKVSPTLFALALAFAANNRETKKYAVSIFPKVVRTQSHLFEFISYVRAFRGMGRILSDAITAWYQNQSTTQLAYQMIKYRNRNGYTTRDVLRLVKPKPANQERSDLYAFGAEKYRETNIPIIEAFKYVQKLSKPDLKIITEYNLPREALPTSWLNDPAVWEVMLPTMPLTAMIRNLGKMASLGLLDPFSTAAQIVTSKLNDLDYLCKSRIHPFNVLLAKAVYEEGRGVKGALSWQPNEQISEALEQAFYNTFGNVTAANKNTLIALDVSSSMHQKLMGSHLNASTAAAAMALMTLKTEPSCIIKGFSHQLVDLKITKYDSLQSIAKKTRIPFGGTDCAAPIIWALKNNIPVETFIVYTDNETWYGDIQPHIALNRYRQTLGINAKLIVVGMTATNISIADPLDPGMMDVVGFDASAPEVIATFSRGF